MSEFPALSIALGGMSDFIDLYSTKTGTNDEHIYRSKTKYAKDNSQDSIYCLSYHKETQSLFVGGEGDDDIRRYHVSRAEDFGKGLRECTTNFPCSLGEHSILSALLPLTDSRSVSSQYAVGYHSGRVIVADIEDDPIKFKRKVMLSDVNRTGDFEMSSVEFLNYEHLSIVNRVRYAKEKDIVLSVSDDSTLQIYSMKSGRVVLGSIGPNFLTSLSYDEKSNLIACGDYTGALYLFDIRKLSAVTLSKSVREIAHLQGCVSKKISTQMDSSSGFHSFWIPETRFFRGGRNSGSGELSLVTVGQDGLSFVLSVPDLKIIQKEESSDVTWHDMEIIDFRVSSGLRMMDKRDVEERLAFLAEYSKEDEEIRYLKIVLGNCNEICLNIVYI